MSIYRRFRPGETHHTIELVTALHCLSGSDLRALLFSALLGCTPLLQAAGETPVPPSLHPLTGTWSWTLFGGTCTETYQYRANRTVLATSGQEVSEKKYVVASAPDAQGFYKLVETVVRQNEKADCSGVVPEGPGEQTTRFIQFSPQRDKLLICEEASLKACFGPLLRAP